LKPLKKKKTEWLELQQVSTLWVDDPLDVAISLDIAIQPEQNKSNGHHHL
jgi:hypothetical protein